MNSVTEDDRLIDWQTDLRCSFVSSRIARCHAVGTAAVGSPCRPRPGSAARQSTSRPSCTQLRTHRHQRCSVLAAKVVSKPKWWASAWQSMTDLAGIIITRSFCFFRERPMFSVCPWRLWAAMRMKTNANWCVSVTVFNESETLGLRRQSRLTTPSSPLIDCLHDVGAVSTQRNAHNVRSPRKQETT